MFEIVWMLFFLKIKIGFCFYEWYVWLFVDNKWVCVIKIYCLNIVYEEIIWLILNFFLFLVIIFWGFSIDYNNVLSNFGK